MKYTLNNIQYHNTTYGDAYCLKATHVFEGRAHVGNLIY